MTFIASISSQMVRAPRWRTSPWSPRRKTTIAVTTGPTCHQGPAPRAPDGSPCLDIKQHDVPVNTISTVWESREHQVGRSTRATNQIWSAVPPDNGRRNIAAKISPTKHDEIADRQHGFRPGGRRHGRPSVIAAPATRSPRPCADTSPRYPCSPLVVTLGRTLRECRVAVNAGGRRTQPRR